MNKKIQIIAFLLLTTVLACESIDRNIKVVKATELGATKMSDLAFFNLLLELKGIEAELSFSDNTDHVIDQLAEGTIDMAIIPNNVDLPRIGRDIRTVSALLPRILLILYETNTDTVGNLAELLNDKKVGFETMDHSDSTFFKILLDHYNTDWSNFECIQISQEMVSGDEKINTLFDTVDVFVTLTHLRNELISKILDQGNSIFSLDDPTLFNRGSSVNGLTLDYPQVYPFLLPKSVYGGRPVKPVFTLGVRDILVCHKNLNESVVYDMAEIINSKRTLLTQRNRNYGLLPDELGYQQFTFSFPFHKGSLAYIDRDKPSFFERYAELFGVVFSIGLVLFGGVASIRQRLKKIKKDRIDLYYKHLLEFREKRMKGASGCGIEELNAIRNEAFEALMNERLIADNSFEIFLNLYKEIKDEMMEK
jgi:TRAP-type uncharacterized transport system substrate-binding protein